MSRSFFRLTPPLVAGCALALTMFACGSDDDDGTGTGTAGTGGTAGEAGSGGDGGTAGTGTGGTTSTGGTTAAGGTGGNGGDDELYTCIANQPPAPEPGTAGEGEDCCGGDGVCADPSDLPEAQRGVLSAEACTSDLLCAPKPELIPDSGVAPSCTATLGDLELEGRCIPKCFVSGPGTGNLDEGDCPDLGVEVLCAPCYSPLDGELTGACDQDGDAPVEDAPEPFAECGNGLGFCVPTSLVAGAAGDAADALPQDSCEDGEVCAPKGQVEDTGSCFEKCETDLGGASACVPTYIVDAQEPGVSDLLGQSTCAEGETCTPCISPLDGEVTGACDN